MYMELYFKLSQTCLDQGSILLMLMQLSKTVNQISSQRVLGHNLSNERQALIMIFKDQSAQLLLFLKVAETA